MGDLVKVWTAFHHEAHWQVQWMWVNFVLAVLPGLGAYVLHRWWHGLGRLRWGLVGAVGLLLPNAPYVVTDLVHLRYWIGSAPTRTAVYIGVIPMFTLLIGSGVLSYAYTLHLMRKHMRAADWSRRRRIAAEVSVNLLCALGVALGRISRLNSWDVFDPYRLLRGLRIVSLDPRSVAFALVIVLVAGFAVDWVASEAAHSVRDRLRHR